MRRSRFRGGLQQFYFEHIKFDMSIKHLCGDVEWAIVYKPGVLEKGHGSRYKFVNHMLIALQSTHLMAFFLIHWPLLSLNVFLIPSKSTCCKAPKAQFSTDSVFTPSVLLLLETSGYYTSFPQREILCAFQEDS